MLEINPLPGLSPAYCSILTCRPRAGGTAYDGLIGRIIGLAAGRARD